MDGDTKTNALSLYGQLLGGTFDRLPPVLKDLHDGRPRKSYAGRCNVKRGRNWIAGAVARVARLPHPRSNVPITVEIERTAAGETWTRRFGQHEMRSTLRRQRDTLEERLGLVALSFELIAEADRIVWMLKRARLLLLPLPISWFAACAATEHVQDGRYCFDVRAEIIGIGLIVHYEGWLIEHEPRKEADSGWRMADSHRAFLRIRAPAACVTNGNPAGHIHVQQLSGSASDHPLSAIRYPLPPYILVFDGVCVLCSRWVRFVLKHDRHGKFRFAAMQTPRGRELLTQHGIDPDDPMSFLLLEEGAGYMDTDAIVRVLRSVGGGWTLVASLLQAVPRFVRDALYRWIARHRYRLFGRRDACLVPEREMSDRFLH